MALLKVLQFLAFLSAALADVSPVCKPSTGSESGPALPTLPSVFMTKLEGSILNKNTSFSGEEYFDNTTDQVAILYVSQTRRIYRIMNYRIDEGITIDLNRGNCTVFKLSNMSRGGLAPKYDKHGHEHVASISDFFSFGKQFNESFRGQTIIRGTRVLYWESCINHGNHSYTIDWYFSVPEWKTTGGKSPVPVRCVINGTGYSHRTDKFHSFYHVYDFTDFQAGVHPPPQKFQPPFGTYCQDEKRAKMLPKLPKWFSNTVEWLNSRERRASVMTHHYDMERKLVRVDHTPSRNHLSYVDIHDFNTGVTYSIDDVNSNCNMTPLNHSFYGKHDDHDDDVHMKSPFELFWHNNNSIKYEGVAVIRGVDTNVWISRTTSERRGRNTTYLREWYFSQPSWHMNAGHIKNQTEVPMYHRVWSNGTSMWSMNIFNFDGENPNLSVFDVGKCFSWSTADRRSATFLFVGDYKLVSQQSDPFRNMVMEEISKKVEISILRISAVSVYGFSDRIWVKLTILKRPTMEGKTVHMAKKEPELNLAFAKLETLVGSGNLKVKIPGQSDLVAAKSFYEVDNFGGPSAKPIMPTKKPGTKASTVGIAVATLLIGLFVGVFICFLVLKRRGVSLFSYQRHTDEL